MDSVQLPVEPMPAQAQRKMRDGDPVPVVDVPVRYDPYDVPESI